MARLTAPLFSLTASGTLAKALTFATWRGIPYVRTRVIPANPNTADQQEVRGVFSTLSEMWKRMPQLARDPFVYAARGRPFTARNVHVALNVPLLKGEADMDKIIQGVGGGSAIPFLTAPGVDGADGTITCTCTPDTPPIGYTIHSAVGVACPDGDPSPVLTVTTFVNEDVSAPYELVVTVAANGDHQFSAWPIYTRDSDGVKFAGPPTHTKVTVTGV